MSNMATSPLLSPTFNIASPIQPSSNFTSVSSNDYLIAPISNANEMSKNENSIDENMTKSLEKSIDSEDSIQGNDIQASGTRMKVKCAKLLSGREHDCTQIEQAFRRQNRMSCGHPSAHKCNYKDAVLLDSYDASCEADSSSSDNEIISEESTVNHSVCSSGAALVEENSTDENELEEGSISDDIEFQFTNKMTPRRQRLHSWNTLSNPTGSQKNVGSSTERNNFFEMQSEDDESVLLRLLELQHQNPYHNWRASSSGDSSQKQAEKPKNGHSCRHSLLLSSLLANQCMNGSQGEQQSLSASASPSSEFPTLSKIMSSRKKWENGSNNCFRLSDMDRANGELGCASHFPGTPVSTYLLDQFSLPSSSTFNNTFTNTPANTMEQDGDAASKQHQRLKKSDAATSSSSSGDCSRVSDGNGEETPKGCSLWIPQSRKPLPGPKPSWAILQGAAKREHPITSAHSEKMSLLIRSNLLHSDCEANDDSSCATSSSSSNDSVCENTEVSHPDEKKE